MRTQSLGERILTRIDEMKQDACFSRSEFADLGSREAISQVLSRLERKGVLGSPLHGYYFKAKYSDFLKEWVCADMGELAEAIVRNSGWVILPCGDILLNQLGLSTQVPYVWSYVSTGPYGNYNANGTQLTFKHVTSRDLFNMSRKSAMIVQALKTLGKNGVTESVIARLRDRLTMGERRLLRQETMRTTAWIFESIQRIAKESCDD